MTTPRTWPPALAPARGDRHPNCPAAERLRLRILAAHRKGEHQTVSELSGTALRCVRAQYQGEDPLTVNVVATALLLMPRGVAAAALDELGEPAGVAAIVRPSEGSDRDVISAHAAILRALSHLEGGFAEALEDGGLSEGERAELLGAVRELKSRCHDLEARLMGSKA